MSDDDIDSLFQGDDEEELLDESSEVAAEAEQMSDDDIDSLFQVDDEEELLDESSEAGAEAEQMSDDDIDITNPEEADDIKKDSEIEADKFNIHAEENTVKKEELVSENLGIIPGLFANPLSVRSETNLRNDKVESLPELPPFGFENNESNEKEKNMLRELAKKLKENSVDVQDNRFDDGDYNTDNESDSSFVASETMANIYTLQGLYSKALEIFYILRDKETDSEKKDHYTSKIESLKKEL